MRASTADAPAQLTGRPDDEVAALLRDRGPERQVIGLTVPHVHQADAIGSLAMCHDGILPAVGAHRQRPEGAPSLRLLPELVGHRAGGEPDRARRRGRPVSTDEQRDMGRRHAFLAVPGQPFARGLSARRQLRGVVKNQRDRRIAARPARPGLQPMGCMQVLGVRHRVLHQAVEALPRGLGGEDLWEAALRAGAQRDGAPPGPGRVRRPLGAPRPPRLRGPPGRPRASRGGCGRRGWSRSGCQLSNSRPWRQSRWMHTP